MRLILLVAGVYGHGHLDSEINNFKKYYNFITTGIDRSEVPILVNIFGRSLSILFDDSASQVKLVVSELNIMM